MTETITRLPTLVKEPRPKTVKSRSYRVRMQCGNLYIIISHKDHTIFEVFTSLGKGGGCMFSNMAALTTSITMGIRYGIDPQIYIDKLKGINCPSKTWEDNILYLSCADAIAQTMEKELQYLKSGTDELPDKLLEEGEDQDASNCQTYRYKIHQKEDYNPY